ncbi:hypothetical protein [Desulfuromonas thiophila]|uniref:hypothetical protein n=1 Tax=Desulfuromonas thiophila TaxID=57664 RepID=UPI0024A7C48A|nr:hypothetical protein [Desulfuromonas thiophila]
MPRQPAFDLALQQQLFAFSALATGRLIRQPLAWLIAMIQALERGQLDPRALN